MKDSDYHICRGCSLIFARRRQSPESIALFYRWFAYLEQRDYAVYPPPQNYIQAKYNTAGKLLDYLADHGILSPGMTIAHVRCDVGSMLVQIGERFPGGTLHGLDYFDSNVRYAREHGLEGVDLLDPARINLADGTAYDVIVCNHMLTHSLDPVADLRTLYDALKPGGVLFLYNEVDHFLRFEPKGPFYQWVALNNFHKQLFAPASLEYFLTGSGFSIEARSHRNFFMQFVARREAEPGEARPSAAVASAARAEVPVMTANFRRWAARRDSPLHGLYKVSGKLRKALLRPS
jgi:SAM-dependent methyltransferase